MRRLSGDLLWLLFVDLLAIVAGSVIAVMAGWGLLGALESQVFSWELTRLRGPGVRGEPDVWAWGPIVPAVALLLALLFGTVLAFLGLCDLAAVLRSRSQGGHHDGPRRLRRPGDAE